MWWKRRKTFAAIANRRQWQLEFDPTQTSATEIELEQGDYLVRESSVFSTPTYIITE
jgi:hypothetical protein|tara:strand:- start:190 stop:360 length:171 start_codon:yes stop_codon:yes gene_type:complete